MKKLYLLLLAVILLLSLVACKSETVKLHCDGENCDNLVEVKVEEDNMPNEDWVVFCQNCAGNVLAD